MPTCRPSVPANAWSVVPPGPTVAAVLLPYDWAPSGTTWPGWSAQVAPPSGDSAVFVSRCGSLESVLRKPPQNARRPPGSTASAALVIPVQPLWIGLVAPTPPGARDDGVVEVLRVRAGGVRPHQVEHPVTGAREPDLVGARTVRRRDPASTAQRSRTGPRMRRAARRWRPGGASPADELDPVAVRVTHERDEGTLGAAARAVRRLL